MPAALVLQSHDNGSPGLLGAWAPTRGIALDVIRVDRWPSLPDPSEYLFAVALGADAPIDDDWPAWARTELEWLALADSVGVPVLGIGFGAQALGLALGGSVRRVSAGETAWATVETSDPARLPSGPWLVPRNDAISAPSDAEQLAHGASGPLAFAVGRHLGLYFHPEITPAVLARQRRVRAVPGDAALLRQAREYRDVSRLAAFALFDAFASRAGLPAAGGGRPLRGAESLPTHAKRRLVFTPYRDAHTY